MTFRRAFFAAFSAAVLLGLAWGCAATGDSGTGNPGGGANNVPVSPTNDASITPNPNTQDAAQLKLNPLCDERASFPCVPDSPASCSSFTPAEDASTSADASEDASSMAEDGSTSAEASTSTDASSGGQGGAANADGGSGGDSASQASPGGAGDGGSSGAGDGGAGGAAGATGVPPVGSPTYACQVQRTEAAPTTPFSRCALAGPGGENAPCLTSSDCQAGLGCVGDPVAGASCLNFCCQDADDCERGTYCTERPLRDALVNNVSKGANALQVPVCVPAQNCDLSAPYPCAKGSECACKTGTACMVVRSDGTTTCTTPGAGELGEACPCAWGHVCSAATNTCLKLCNTRDESPCGSGKCQSASQLPDGWGVCIGATSGG